MAKAYIALGLYSEAVMSLKRTPGPEFAPYRNLATLMQNRNKPNVRFFQEMASCQEDSQLWLALAQLVAGQANGVQTLQNSLSGFRKLPPQLRIDYAALSSPELERIGEQALAKKLIADFDEEQVANSSELRFVSALVNLDGGDSAAERTVVEFLDHPQFQEPALAAMLRRKRPMDPAYEEILLGDLPTDIRGTSQISRAGECIWKKPFLSGESNMSHSIANLEHHNIKYDAVPPTGRCSCAYVRDGNALMCRQYSNAAGRCV